MLVKQARLILRSLTSIKNGNANIMAGSLVGINTVISCLSFAGLIFSSGNLDNYILQGFQIFLLSAIFSTMVLFFFSREPLAIATPSNQIIAIFAILATATSISAAQFLPTASIYPLTVFVLAFSTFLTGLAFFLIGYFKLGNLIRYIPYPVSSGFLAGSGWIICEGAIKLLTNISTTTPLILLPFLHLNWLAITGVIFWALLVYMLVYRYRSPIILAVSILCSILVFYLLMYYWQVSWQEIIENKWVISTAQNVNYHGVNIFYFWHYSDFAMILNLFTTIAAVIFVSCISLFLNIVGLEFVTNREVNSNKEIRTAGITNMMIGLCGGISSFISLSNASVANKAGGNSKLTIVFFQCVLLAFLIFGFSLLIYFPKIILACTLMYFGITLILDTFLNNWFKLSSLDFFLTLFILFEIVFFGLLHGLFLGLVLAAIIFVVNYSRINVVHFIMEGQSLHSNTQRNREVEELIDKSRKKIMFFKLGGFIFFGTANNLLSQIKQLFSSPDKEPPMFIILDFSLVDGLDSSALMIFSKLSLLAKEYRTNIIFTKISTNLMAQFKAWKILKGQESNTHSFADNDLALEWCEKELLKNSLMPTGNKWQANLTKVLSIDQVLPDLNPAQREKFKGYFKQKKLYRNGYLFMQGDKANAMYFIESGEISVVLERRDGKTERLRKIFAGNIVGEMGLYNQSRRIASAIAVTDCVLYELTQDSLVKMQEADQQLVIALDRFIIAILSERLSFLDKQVRQLL